VLVGAQIASQRSGATVGAAAAARTTFTVAPANAVDAALTWLGQTFSDLLPWSELNPAPDDGPWARYTVDPTLPGARQLERILGRIRRAGVTRTLKLVYVDMPVALPTSDFRLPLEYPPHSGTSILGLFALRCPVLARAEGRAAVRMIGAHTFAELAPCASGTRP